MFTTKRFGKPIQYPPTEHDQLDDMLTTFQSYGVLHALSSGFGFIIGMMFGVIFTTPLKDPYASQLS